MLSVLSSAQHPALLRWCGWVCPCPYLCVTVHQQVHSIAVPRHEGFGGRLGAAAHHVVSMVLHEGEREEEEGEREERDVRARAQRW